jgi:hypothetical protein
MPTKEFDMTQDPSFYLITGSFALAGIALIVIASLRGWRDWIDLKRAELDAINTKSDAPAPSANSRIEVADLKERVKKLEAIAAGIDL